MIDKTKLIEEILNSAAEFSACGQVVPLSFAKAQLYLTTGNRLLFEEDYFARRKQLAVLALSVKLGADENLKLLEAVIISVCDEYTWALPAHLPLADGAFAAESSSCIDLFAAETGEALTEIKQLLQDKLTEATRARIDSELERRIFTPFLAHSWAFETKENNWSAVIAGSIGLSALYQLTPSDARLQQILAKLRTSFDSYLRSFGADGACEEGVGYWAYGFGYYCYFAERLAAVLADFSYLENPKVKKIAAFPYYTLIGKGAFLPYSDYSEVALPSGLVSFCHARFGVKVPPVEQISGLDFDPCYRFAHLSRNLAWTEEIKPEKEASFSHYFPDVQWLAVKSAEQDFFFSAKGGHNGESHNQNDLGSFVIGSTEELLLTDLGAGEYTREYFDDAYRYTYLVNSSESHSVPIINGTFQVAGQAAHTTSKVQRQSTATVFKLAIKQAYPVTGFTFEREFLLEENSKRVTLTDRFSFLKETDNTIVENFVSKLKPIIVGNQVVISGQKKTCRLTFPQGTLQIIPRTYQNHHGEKQTVYFIQASYLIKTRAEIKIGIEVRENERLKE